MQRTLQMLALASTILMFVASNLMIAFFGFNVTSELDEPITFYIVPAGYAFAIWFFIYIGFIALGAYQLNKSRLNDTQWQKARIYIIINGIANTLWFSGVLINKVWLTMIFMAILLYTLIQLSIILGLGEFPRDQSEKWQVKVPLALYFGWITIATPINFTSFLMVDLGFRGTGFLSPEIWSILILAVATAIVAWMYINRKANATYLLVGVWGLTAIFVSNLNMSMEVGIAALLLAGILILVLILYRVKNGALAI
ncbi:MAG: hypothetical protein AAFO07_03445 [Bacteroidota bacterium]